MWQYWRRTVFSLSCHESLLHPLPLVTGVVAACADEGRRPRDEEDVRLLSVLSLMILCPGDSLGTGFFLDACFIRSNGQYFLSFRLAFPRALPSCPVFRVGASLLQNQERVCRGRERTLGSMGGRMGSVASPIGIALAMT